MFKIVKQSEIKDYKRQILDLKVELSQAQFDVAFYKSAGAADEKRVNDLKEELRVERKRRELAEASVKALEDHLRVLNETKK